MTARMRRLASDYEEVKKNFAGHKYIRVEPIGSEPPEKYHVTYFVNGIYLLPDGRIETLGRHEVEITLHADYPRYKPLCKILTPIWHPNFRDGQICIGDIWGAGESLSDIIINIGDMIQYKSWNAYSPLSADAAKWAMENRHLFPVGNIDLYPADYASSKEPVEIDLLDDDQTGGGDAPAAEPAQADDGEILTETGQAEGGAGPAAQAQANTSGVPEASVQTSGGGASAAPAQANGSEASAAPAQADGNDFEITAEELAGIEFVPTAERMQKVSHGGTVKGKQLNFKTVLVKGLLWAFLGALLGFIVSEWTENNITSDAMAARISGNAALVEYFEYQGKADAAFGKFYDEFERYCREEGKSADSSTVFTNWLTSEASSKAEGYWDDYSSYNDKSEDALYDAYTDEYDSDQDKLGSAVATVTRVGTALWSAVIALFIGLFLGIGEGVYYGSKEQAIKYGLIGAGVSLAIGFVSGYLAQWMYSSLLGEDPAGVSAAFVRGLGWAIMGLGIGVAVGLIKPEKKRILFCVIGGLVGAFVGGFLFNYVCDVIPNDMVARGVAIVIMGGLIGVGVGLLEQFAKSAWLKVIRGEFEGKEYLVFDGTTSIGNNGKNTIVLFKDKLVGPHHCDITLDGSKYVLTDCGTPMGTFVNGQKTVRHILREGDAIAIGNSVLVFHTK